MPATFTALLLPLCLGLALLIHLGLASLVRGVIASFEPLARDEAPIAEAARANLWTADARDHRLWWLLLCTGLVLWLSLSVSAGLLLLAPLLLGAGVFVDLQHWTRVVVSPSAVWRQDGWRQPVERWPMGRIVDLRVEEADGRGWSLRGPWAGPLAALWLRDADADAVLLLVTDAARGHEGLETVANQIRLRLAEGARQAAQGAAWTHATALAEASLAAAQMAAERPSTPEGRAAAEARLARQRQRERALDPVPVPAAPGGRRSAASPTAPTGESSDQAPDGSSTGAWTREAAPPAGPPGGRS